jgi:hypothetical protein
MKIAEAKEALIHYNFSESHVRNIMDIFASLLQFGIALDECGICNTGGGCNHFYFKLSSGRWVWFHGESQDITISEPIDTATQVYDALWDNEGKSVTSLALSNYYNDKDSGNFEPVGRIVQDIREENFYKIFI